MTAGDRVADFVVSHSRLVIVILLLVTAGVAAGVDPSPDSRSIGDVQADSPEQRALDDIEANFSTDDRTVAQVVVRGDDVLTRESMVETLRLQRTLRDDEEIGPTLADDRPTVGLANLVATAAIHAGGGESATGTPSLDDQISRLESMDDDEFDRVLSAVLDPESESVPADPYRFLPSDYEPGTTDAEARTLFVFQTTDEGGTGDEGATGDEDATDDDSTGVTTDEAFDAQVAIADIVDERFGDSAFVFGAGIVESESGNALVDSFVVLLPLAFLLVLVVLAVAYRDVLDVALGLVGVGLVLAWLGGVMGWLGIPSSQLLIAVPFLLIGLSIDYALHVVMRYREAGREAPEADPAAAMRAGLAGVLVALAAATLSTGIGFLSNLVSSIPAIRDFALLSAAGIFATFVVFGLLVPALKVELDGWLADRGRDRRKTAFGVEAGVANRVLSVGGEAALRVPVAVVALALVVSAAGGVAATDIDTEFNEQDFLPLDAPEWAKSLPGPLAPGDYDIRENAEFVGDSFARPGGGGQTEVLVEGNVTDPETLDRIVEGQRVASDRAAFVARSDGTATVESPATVLRSVADRDEDLARRIDASDTDGDGLPDENLTAVYDALFDAAPEEAATVLHRTDDGRYVAARLSLSVRGSASAQDAAADTRAVAEAVADAPRASAIATGGQVVTAVAQDGLLETLVEALAVTLVAILGLLAALYWRRYRAPALGVVTLVPVVCALAWLLGTMWVLDIPFNTETAVITSLAIGLGVDYSIHFSERFVEERRGSDSTAETLRTTITGTGGALLGSATTTAAGFGVLGFALTPPIRRFGIVTGLSIVFAFVACMTVLPSLLVLWDRYVA
ncbi:MMPL family transporter [Halorussus salilacus]|uniref:efflux RND transporter permease subunit n=1 Tax=Halorussus salilacus TaxID=2953750 RepID=UPI00209EABCE|nr:MMPL family transporter [Halorussus salilacus]USZ67437.1 MMPL family transporter [Halorussus salilacus]